MASTRFGPRLIGGGTAGTLRDALREVAKRRGEAIADVIERELALTVKELQQLTPKDTGAAAGTTAGSRRPIYKSHPGYGMKIGNDQGDSGWQVYNNRDTRYWAITNPMWVDYLRRINYEHPTQANFLETAHRNMQQRLIKLRA